MMADDPIQDGQSTQRSGTDRTGNVVAGLVLGLLAWVLVLGLGFSFALLARATSWRVILPVEFALLGLVVLAAVLSVRRSK